MTTIAMAESGGSHEPEFPSGFSTCMAGSQVIGPFSAAFPRALARGYIGSGGTKA